MKRILFFGDSLTAGYGLRNANEQSFPALIRHNIEREGLNYQVINAGISGDTTQSGLQRLGKYLSEPIDVFVLALGANDMIRGYSPATTLQNLRKIVQQVQMRYPSAKLVLLGMQLPEWIPGQRAKEFRELYRTLADEFRMSFLPFLLDGVAGITHLNMPDRIHPLAEGYQVIAGKVWPLIRQLL
ncbi:MAG: arylesterase [Bacteroidota bacterium]